ncbi:MAG TPA: ABC transporter permease [Streptosporangiaceae bacterium]|jgi:peptide/nickel transport system permease protein
MTAAAAATRVPATGPAGRSALARLTRRPAGTISLGLVTLLVLVAVFAPYLAPYDGAAQHIPQRLQGPSRAHLLGTDQLGRDLLSRIMLGLRIELSVAIPGVAIALALGLILGLAAGYLGGRSDNVVVVCLDTIQAFPSMVLALVLVAVLGPSLPDLVAVLAITFAPQSARATRASVLALRRQPFIEAERSLGVRTPRILAVHVVPNIIAPLLILLTMNIPSAITVEAGLSFLGLGVQPPTPSWGVILSDGFANVYQAPWAVIWVGLALVITTVGFTTLGETLRDVCDPHRVIPARTRRGR